MKMRLRGQGRGPEALSPSTSRELVVVDLSDGITGLCSTVADCMRFTSPLISSEMSGDMVEFERAWGNSGKFGGTQWNAMSFCMVLSMILGASFGTEKKYLAPAPLPADILAAPVPHPASSDTTPPLPSISNKTNPRQQELVHLDYSTGRGGGEERAFLGYHKRPSHSRHSAWSRRYYSMQDPFGDHESSETDCGCIQTGLGTYQNALFLQSHVGKTLSTCPERTVTLGRLLPFLSPRTKQ